jgi:N-acetylmuramoyl-L-alanine amidase
MSDPQRSKDVAAEVCRALEDKLGPESASIHPGNYHVLRNTEAPAILGEASFMTNMKNERLLSYHRQLMLEAEGYFTGILNYFRKGSRRGINQY